MMKTETIWLQRPASDVPWGFRLRGGKDYPYPLTVQRVSPGSIASTGLAVGDVILQIADIDTCNLSFAQSQDLIKDCGNLLQFHISKGSGKASSVPPSPQPRQEQPSFQQQQSQPSPKPQQVASPTAAAMASSGVHDLFRDMYRNSEHMATTPEPYYSPTAAYGAAPCTAPGPTSGATSGATSPGVGSPYGYNSQQPQYGSEPHRSPRQINIHHLGSAGRDSPQQIGVHRYGGENEQRPGSRQIQIQHLGRNDNSNARHTTGQYDSSGSNSEARNINIQHMGGGGDHGSRVIPINSSPAAIDNNIYQSAQPEPPSYRNLESQAIRVQSPTVPKNSFSADPQYPYQAAADPQPSYPYQPAAPNSTYDAVGPYNPVSSQSPASTGPSRSFSTDADQAFYNTTYGPQASGPALVSSPSSVGPLSPMSVSTGFSGQSSNQSLSPIYPYAPSAASSTSELSELSAPSLPDSKPPPIPVGGWATPELSIDGDHEAYHTPRQSPMPISQINTINETDTEHAANPPVQNYKPYDSNINVTQPFSEQKVEPNPPPRPISRTSIRLVMPVNSFSNNNPLEQNANKSLPARPDSLNVSNNNNRHANEQNGCQYKPCNETGQFQSQDDLANGSSFTQSSSALPEQHGWNKYPPTVISNQDQFKSDVMTTSQGSIDKPLQFNAPTQYQSPTEYEAPSHFQTSLEGPAETVLSPHAITDVKQAPPVAPKPLNRRPPSAVSVEVSPEQRPKLQRQNISVGGMPSSPSIGGRRTPSYAGTAYGQSPVRAKAPSPAFGNVQSPTYGGVQSPTYGGVQSPSLDGVQSPRYASSQPAPNQQMSNPAQVQSPTYGGVQSPSYGGVQSPSYGGVQSPSYGGVQSPSYGGVQSPTYGGVQSPTYGGVQSPTYGGVQSPSQGGVQSPTYGSTQSPRVYGSSNEPTYGQSGPGISSPVQNQSSQNANSPYSPQSNSTPRPFGVRSPENQTVNSPTAYGPKSPSSYDPYSPKTPQGFRSIQPNLGSPQIGQQTAPSFNQPYSPSAGPTSPGQSPLVKPTSPAANSPGMPMGQTQTPQFNQYTPNSPGQNALSPSMNQNNLQNLQYDSNPPGAPDIYSMQQQPPPPPPSLSTDNGSNPGGPPPAPPAPAPSAPAPPPPPPKPVSPTPPRPRPSSRSDNLSRPSSQQEQRIPDAVLNMAAKGPPEKKPFTYAPSADILKEQRDKVRRKPQGAALPRYQNLLNMPSFDDSTPSVQKVQSPTAQAVNQADLPSDGVVAHAQYNSPLNVYSDGAVNETFAAQTAGAVNVTPQRQSSKPGDQDVTQSPTYRAIHGLEQEKPAPHRTVPQGTVATPEECMGNAAVSPVFGVTNKTPTRQGLSFMILQCLYESDEPASLPASLPETADQDASVSHPNGSHQERSCQQNQASEDEQQSNRKVALNSNGIVAPPKVLRMPSKDDELKFSGTLRQSDIPSKSFQKLQQFTGADGSSYVDQPTPEEEEEIGGYDEASIRYRGGHIPSKSFKILQNMTGGPAELPPRPASRNRSKERELDGPDYQAPQNGAEMRYGGAHIPGQSFKILQQSIGDDGSPVPDSGTGLPPDGSQGSIDRRRQPRRRARSRSAQRVLPPPRVSTPSKDLDEPEPQRDFDERAYLSGRVAILRDPSEIPAKPYKEIINKPSRADEPEDQEAKHFDEQAFLQGKVPIMGNENQKEYAPKVKEDETPVWAKKVQSKKGQENFQDPLARRGSRDVITPDWAARAPSREGNVDGPAIAVDELGYLITAPKKDEEEKPEWAKKAEDKKFDEARILAAKAEAAAKSKDEIDPKWKRHVQRRESLSTVTVDELGYLVNPAKQQGQTKTEQEDWKKFLEKQNQGKLEVDELGYLKTTKTTATDQISSESAPQGEEEPAENQRPFDERAFLLGRIPLVRGGEADLSNLPPPPRTKKPSVDEQEEEERLKRPFDEGAFLSGNLSITGGCLEGGNKPPRSGRTRRRYRDKAPWERGDMEDEGVSSESEFDERAFLRGKVPLVRQSSESNLYGSSDEGFSRIPSKMFRRLSRSVSREASREGTPDSDGNLSMRRTQSDDRGAESDSGEAYSSMYYKGKNIPSKTFMKLQKNVRSRPQREPDREQEGIDVDKAMETMSIGQHDPSKYMEQLKQHHAESTNGNAAPPQVQSQQPQVQNQQIRVQSQQPQVQNQQVRVQSQQPQVQNQQIRVQHQQPQVQNQQIRVQHQQPQVQNQQVRVQSQQPQAQQVRVQSQQPQQQQVQNQPTQQPQVQGQQPQVQGQPQAQNKPRVIQIQHKKPNQPPQGQAQQVQVRNQQPQVQKQQQPQMQNVQPQVQNVQPQVQNAQPQGQNVQPQVQNMQPQVQKEQVQNQQQNQQQPQMQKPQQPQVQNVQPPVQSEQPQAQTPQVQSQTAENKAAVKEPMKNGEDEFFDCEEAPQDKKQDEKSVQKPTENGVKEDSQKQKPAVESKEGEAKAEADVTDF